MNGQANDAEESTDMTEQSPADDRPPTEDQPDAPTAETDAPSADDALAAAEAERDQFRNMALRYRADLENYRKRAEREMATARERANERLLLKVADFADDFGRALDNPPQDADNWLEGVRIAMRGMETMLAAEGVSRVQVDVGVEFDAVVHEAVFMQPTDEVPEGTVAGVFRNGYTLHDRLLRAAQVSVAQALPQPEQNQERTQDAEPNDGAASAEEIQ